MGALTTDFSLVKAGALHRANGGYLILDARQLLLQPFAWEGLKRSLYARSIRMESHGDMMSLISTISLEPEPIPLNVKVILLGDGLLYYLLYEEDSDFAELFKVCADFDDNLDRTPESCLLDARFVASESGKFWVRTFADIDQAIEILTGCSAGMIDANGIYPRDSINGLVASRLQRMTELRLLFGAEHGHITSADSSSI